MFTAKLFDTCCELISESGSVYRGYGWSYGVWILKGHASLSVLLQYKSLHLLYYLGDIVK
jgi:hypothetical protein